MGLFEETQRLLKETERRSAELAVINGIQQGMAAELQFEAILDLVGDKLREVFDTGNTAVRKRLGLPDQFGSCHTGLIGGYVIEGHVNAREIRRLLTEKPKAIGLAVPGMPVGSPGMDGAVYGDRRDPYDVLLVSRDGSTRVYQSYNRKAQSV